jgi:hypothetical protein
LLKPAASAAISEVVGLHQFLQAWFNGVVPKTRANFDRLASSWPSEFMMLSPLGALRSSTELLDQTYGEHGAYPQLRIEIRNPVVPIATSQGLYVVVYEEWHLDSESTEARICSATLSCRDGGVQSLVWVYAHESALPPGTSAA